MVPIRVTCVCGAEFYTTEARRAKGRGKYCSRGCRLAHAHVAAGDPAQRFWGKVKLAGPAECWPWLAGTDADGYGVFSMVLSGRRYNVRAHRAAFYFIHGHWPEPQALHGCDNPPCCNAGNPLHVHEGTMAQNSREMHDRGRAPRNSARITLLQATEIRERYTAGGVRQADLAAEFGICTATVSQITRGVTWRQREQG